MYIELIRPAREENLSRMKWQVKEMIKFLLWDFFYPPLWVSSHSLWANV